MRSNRFAVLTLAVLVLTASAVRASSWSTVGGTCVPDESDTRGAAPDWIVSGPGANDGRVVPSGVGGTGNVTLRCAITNPLDVGLVNPTWSTWEITYADTDGMAMNAQVTMSICATPKTPGPTVCALQFDSNALPVGIPNFVSGGIGVVWDFVNNYYFLEVALNDFAGPPTSQFYGAALRD